MPLTRKELRIFAAGCENLISLGLTTVLSDDERCLVASYISELQAMLNRRTQENAFTVKVGEQYEK